MCLNKSHTRTTNELANKTNLMGELHVILFIKMRWNRCTSTTSSDMIKDRDGQGRKSHKERKEIKDLNSLLQ